MKEIKNTNQIENRIEIKKYENEKQSIVCKLEGLAKKRLKVIQSLLEPYDRSEYGERLRAGAKKLGVSVRSVQ